MAAAWWDADWPFRHTCLIHNEIYGALTNFPVRIRLPHFASGFVDSIRVEDSAQTTTLKHEVDVSRDGDLDLHVKVASVGANAITRCYVYFGNPYKASVADPTNVWDSNFKAVWHLGETTGNYLDSTGNNHDATTTTVTSRTNEGDFPGYAVGLDGVDDYVSVPDSDDFSFTDGAGNDQACTIEAMFWIDGSPATSICLMNKYKSVAHNREWYIMITTSRAFHVRFVHIDSYLINIGGYTSALPAQAWNYVGVTYNGSESHTGVNLYSNGVLDNSLRDTQGSYTGMSNGTAPVEIGVHDASSNRFLGKVAEIRLSDIVRSADWIGATRHCLIGDYVEVLPLETNTVGLSRLSQHRLRNKIAMGLGGKL